MLVLLDYMKRSDKNAFVAGALWEVGQLHQFGGMRSDLYCVVSICLGNVWRLYVLAIYVCSLATGAVKKLLSAGDPALGALMRWEANSHEDLTLNFRFMHHRSQAPVNMTQSHLVVSLLYVFSFSNSSSHPVKTGSIFIPVYQYKCSVSKISMTVSQQTPQHQPIQPLQVFT